MIFYPKIYCNCTDAHDYKIIRYTAHLANMHINAYFNLHCLMGLMFKTVCFFRQNLTVSCDILIEAVNGGVFLAARVNQGGESVRDAMGVFYWAFGNGTYKVTNDISEDHFH